MAKRKVSVIIPAYNAENYILSALSTVWHQTYRPIEVILVDDGSKHSMLPYVEKFCHDHFIKLNYSDDSGNNWLKAEFNDKQNHKNFQILFHRQTNGGPSKARNTGIKISSSDFIAFLDVDDLWEKKKIELQMNLIINSQCDFVFTNNLVKSQDGVVKQMFLNAESLPFILKENILIKPWKSLISTNYITTPSVLAKKSCFLPNRLFNEKRRLVEDWELWLNLSNKFKLGYIHKPCVTVNKVKNSLSHDKAGMLESAIEVLENFLIKKFDIQHPWETVDLQAREALFDTYKWSGYDRLKAGDNYNARRYLQKALKLKKELRTICYYLLTFK